MCENNISLIKKKISEIEDQLHSLVYGGEDSTLELIGSLTGELEELQVTLFFLTASDKEVNNLVKTLKQFSEGKIVDNCIKHHGR
jgi:VIT1/CCC1 family predicted Fe2+/Mn2+ transporter